MIPLSTSELALACAAAEGGLDTDPPRLTVCSMLLRGSSHRVSAHADLGHCGPDVSADRKTPSCETVLRVQRAEAKRYPVCAKAQALQNARNYTNSRKPNVLLSSVIRRIPAHGLR